MKRKQERKLSSNNDSLLYIHQKKHGYISKLEAKIGKIEVRQLEAMGYIVNAPNSRGNTWKISKRAEKMASSIYRESTLWEKSLDWFNHKIRRIDFSN